MSIRTHLVIGLAAAVPLLPVIGPASAFADPGMPPDPPAIPGQPPTFNPTNQVPPGPNVEIDAYPEALPGVDFIGPEEGMLACGYEGLGRLWKVDDIAFRAQFLLDRQENLIA